MEHVLIGIVLIAAVAAAVWSGSGLGPAAPSPTLSPTGQVLADATLDTEIGALENEDLTSLEQQILGAQ